jgi:hypothetical protein
VNRDGHGSGGCSSRDSHGDRVRTIEHGRGLLSGFSIERTSRMTAAAPSRGAHDERPHSLVSRIDKPMSSNVGKPPPAMIHSRIHGQPHDESEAAP